MNRALNRERPNLGVRTFRKGFTFMEVLIAMVIMTIAVFASISTINYALSMNYEARSREISSARIERIGIEAIIKRAAVTSADISLSIYSCDIPFNIGNPVHRNELLHVQALVYSESMPTSRTMRSPVSLIFVK